MIQIIVCLRRKVKTIRTNLPFSAGIEEPQDFRRNQKKQPGSRVEKPSRVSRRGTQQSLDDDRDDDADAPHFAKKKN